MLVDIYRGNPFYVLAASPQSSRASLIERQEETALFGNEQEADRALAALLNPQTRTDAEIRWFPQMDAAAARDLITFFINHPDSTQMPNEQIPSMLGLFNMLRLALVRIPLHTVSEFDAVLKSIAVAADALIPAQVMEEINADRRQSGFPEISDLREIERQIRDLLHETLIALRDNLSKEILDRELQALSETLTQEYRNLSSPYHNSYFLEIAADQIGTGIPHGKAGDTAQPPEKTEKSFSRTFTFSERDTSGVHKFNDELSKLKLAKAEITACKGFLIKEETFNRNGQLKSVRYDFGLKSISLEGEEAGRQYIFKIDVETIPHEADKTIDSARLADEWTGKHPDRVLSTTVVYTFKEADAIIYLHHGREPV